VGTWLIKLYVGSVEVRLREEILSYINQTALKQKITNIKGPQPRKQQQWEELVGASPFKEIDSFLVMQLWKKDVRVHVRRRTLRLDGIRFPTLPNKAKGAAQLMDRIIGQWDMENPFVAGGDPTSVANKIDQGAIPIGKIYITQRINRT
jgi:hypothetical protein